MSFWRRLKPPRALRKLQPGKLIKDITHAATFLPVVGKAAEGLEAVENAIGKRVDAANRVIDKAKADYEKAKKDSGLSGLGAALKVADTYISDADRAVNASDAAHKYAPLLLGAGALLVVWLVVRKR